MRNLQFKLLFFILSFSFSIFSFAFDQLGPFTAGYYYFSPNGQASVGEELAVLKSESLRKVYSLDIVYRLGTQYANGNFSVDYYTLHPQPDGTNKEIFSTSNTISRSLCTKQTLHLPSCGASECGENQQFNTLTKRCEDIPFCERKSTLDDIRSQRRSCELTSGTFYVNCSDGNSIVSESLETSCSAPPETCKVGSSIWPACLDQIDPSPLPITPPDDKFTPPKGSIIPPDDPYENTPVHQVTPTDSTDTAVLESIKNLNSDQNKALSKISLDLNNSFAKVNNKLMDLNATNDLIGQSIVDQMNQDYKIAEGQRRDSLNQVSAITALGNRLDKIADTQTDELGYKLDTINETLKAANENNGTPSEDGNLTLQKIEDKICDPRTDEFNCEGENGKISSEYVAGLVTDLTGSVSQADSTSKDVLIDSVNGLIVDSGTGQVQGVIEGNIDLMFGALPNIGSCSPLSFPSYFGPVELGCDFSSRFKSIASFILYIYTAWTLISIILSGVTPIPASPNGTRS